MVETVLEVHNLVKNYGTFRAVDGISFSVERGKIVGFLGPNGAGKTTTIQILSGTTLANGGSVKYFGKDFSTHREECLQRINAASAFNTLMGKISVWENLYVFAELYQVEKPKNKISSLLEQFEISDLCDKLYKDLSSGQKTRVNIAKALLNDPELLLMDEPTASLDPDIADKTLSLIENLRKERNLSILYTSHNMNEITRICDEVVFLDHGSIVAHDTPQNLTKRISSATLRISFDARTSGFDEYLKDKNLDATFPEPNTIAILSHEAGIPGILFDLSKTGIWITDIEVAKPTLEDVFLQIARKEKATI
jgi:ABC-2 type transport system ATP-binding protein